MPTIDLGSNAITQSSVAPSIKKPPYLITLHDKTAKNNSFQRFISMDKPELMNGYIQVKGIRCEKEEEEIIKDFVSIITSSPKENVLELMLPNHRVFEIRSLVFNAVKNITSVQIGK